MTVHENAPSILRIDASARREGSVSRDLADDLVARLRAGRNGATVVHRDLASGVPGIDEAWIAAGFTDPDARSDDDRQALALSDELVAELKAADTLVIAMPIYNFGIPAALKTWVDLVSRARVTFRYSEAGPVGLLTGKKAYVVVASGGTEVGSDIDFATGYLRHVLGFVGIEDVTFIAADRLMFGAEESVAKAKAQIEGAVPPARGRPPDPQRRPRDRKLSCPAFVITT
ncbi:MAG: NAD(P)H-dependent oxidoreductase [Rhodospirillaceae bacterium]